MRSWALRELTCRALPQADEITVDGTLYAGAVAAAERFVR
jgi:hypothetical protein